MIIINKIISKLFHWTINKYPELKDKIILDELGNRPVVSIDCENKEVNIPDGVIIFKSNIKDSTIHANQINCGSYAMISGNMMFLPNKRGDQTVY